jgi:hypothetical protein
MVNNLLYRIIGIIRLSLLLQVYHLVRVLILPKMFKLIKEMLMWFVDLDHLMKKKNQYH